MSSTADQTAPSTSLARLPQQIDLEGRFHDLGPETRSMRLFEPAPEQLAGQTWLAEAVTPTNERTETER